MAALRVLAVGFGILAGAAGPLVGGPPIGAWVSARGAALEVSDQATCTFVVPNARADGQCVWHPSSMGGILNIQYQANTPTGSRIQVLYLDIRWVNATTITVTGEVFHRTRW